MKSNANNIMKITTEQDDSSDSLQKSATKTGKSLIYKPEKGAAIMNYTAQPNKNRPKSPIQLQLTEIIEKFKPSFVEESHGDQNNLSNTQLNSSSQRKQYMHSDGVAGGGIAETT